MKRLTIFAKCIQNIKLINIHCFFSHKTIFELEKKRIIEDKREYLEFRNIKNKETRNMIDSIKNQYKNKLNILRERHQNEQYEQKAANEAQRTVNYINFSSF